MKIHRTISIDDYVWLEAIRRLPNVSKIINDLLKDYLDVAEEEQKEETLQKDVENLKKEIATKELQLKEIEEKKPKEREISLEELKSW